MITDVRYPGIALSVSGVFYVWQVHLIVFDGSQILVGACLATVAGIVFRGETLPQIVGMLVGMSYVIVGGTRLRSLSFL